jgi:hypothetical protein
MNGDERLMIVSCVERFALPGPRNELYCQRQPVRKTAVMF